MLKLNVRKNYMTVPAAVKELDKIELVRINQGRYELDHAITKNQEEFMSVWFDEESRHGARQLDPR